MDSTKTLVIGGWRGPSGIGQPQKKVLYALFVQLGQIQFCNIEAFLVSTKKQSDVFIGHLHLRNELPKLRFQFGNDIRVHLRRQLEIFLCASQPVVSKIA